MALFSRKKTVVPRRRQGDSGGERASEESLAQRYAFQRNRTLTGSASSSVVSSNEANAQLKSPRVQTHELVQKRRHVGLIFLLVLVLSGGLFVIISQFTASVVVRARDVSTTLDPLYENVIQEYLSRQPVERLRFATNKDSLTEYVQSKAPEVASAEVEGSAGFGRSQFVISLRQPTAGWNVNGQQQYVDNTGTAFSRNYFTSPKVQIVDKSGIPAGTGPVASNRFLGFVGRVVGLADRQGYVVHQIVIPQNTTRQIEATLEGVSYPIKFSVDRPAGEQVEDMIHALRWFTGKGITPQYLDVRVSGRAFYK